MSDEEVFGTAKPASVMSDEEVFGTPKASVPLPRERPAQAGAPNVSPEPSSDTSAAVPLPRSRPVEAEGDGDTTFDQMGQSFTRGVHALRQSGNVAMLGASARPLNNLTAIEDRLAKGEKPDDIPDNEDLFGARYMSPEQRASLKGELTSGVQSAAQGIAARQADIKKIPVDPDVAATVGAETWSDFWTNFKKAPVKIIANVGAESLPMSAPGLLAGAALGPVGGITAAAAGAGAGSYGVDYLSSVLDAMRDEGVDISDPKEVEAAVGNPEFLKKIGEKAHAHAVPVSALDAASMRMAGTSLLPKSIRPGNIVGEKLLEAPLQVPVQGALGGAGEALGEIAAGDD
jgi:hypothetical protein